MAKPRNRDTNHALVPHTRNLPILVPDRRPVSTPRIDPNLEHLPFHLRSCETLRYTLHSLEYTLSPTGRLRQWCKLQFNLFLWLTIPLLLLGGPLLGILAVLTKATAMLVEITVQVGIVVVVIMALLMMLGLLYVIFK